MSAPKRLGDADYLSAHKESRLTMRLYHFVNARYGLDDIKNSRLKISRLNELNDPFELFSVELPNKADRKAFKEVKARMSEQCGLLCFSKKWSNPVQWSHYADRHHGLCLGFEVADDLVTPVQYSEKRLRRMAKSPVAEGLNSEVTMRRLLDTKYEHWRYECEVRCFLNLQDREPRDGLYFEGFSDSLKLVQVIAGACADVSRSDIRDALGALSMTVDVFKARLAFLSFKVVRNRDESRWV